MVLRNLHEVVGGVLRAREARERGGIGGESGSLLLQRQSAVVPVSPGGGGKFKLWPQDISLVTSG